MAFLIVAAIIGFVVFIDAESLRKSGIRVEPFSSLAWGLASAALAIIFVPFYIVRRLESVPPRRIHQTSYAIAPSLGSSGGVDGPGMKHCSACGFAVRADASYCPSCGHVEEEAPVLQASSGAAVAESPHERLRKLGELRDAGYITPEEFDAKKSQLLDEM